MKHTLLMLAVSAGLIGAAALEKPLASTGDRDAVRVELRSLRSAIFLYRARYGEWPATLAKLAAPGVKIIEGEPQDAWGQRYLWLPPGRTASAGCLLSPGEDGRPGTEDDVEEVCDRSILNQHLVLFAGVDAAEKRRDAYGRLIRLIERDGHRLAWSYGADGRPDTDDDVMARVRKN